MGNDQEILEIIPPYCSLLHWGKWFLPDVQINLRSFLLSFASVTWSSASDEESNSHIIISVYWDQSVLRRTFHVILPLTSLVVLKLLRLHSVQFYRDSRGWS